VLGRTFAAPELCGSAGKLARRNSTRLIDGKEQTVAGAIYECVMSDDLPITGNLARRGSVSKWKIDGKDQSISGAIYDYTKKSPGILDPAPRIDISVTKEGTFPSVSAEPLGDERGERCGAYGDGDGASERARGNLCTVGSTVAYSCVRYYGTVQLYVH